MVKFLLDPPAVGVILILISLFGYISNFLNGRFLNFIIIRWLYFVGAFVHETSHALVCILTGAEIIEYRVLARQPRVIYSNPKVPLVSNTLISFAPVFGGLLFLFLLNRYMLSEQFSPLELHSWADLMPQVLLLLRQAHLFSWQSLIFFLIFLNIGAILSPSLRDIKNIWPVVILLLFLKIPFIASLCLFALMLILVNIGVQLILIVLLQFVGYFARTVSGMRRF